VLSFAIKSDSKAWSHFPCLLQCGVAVEGRPCMACLLEAGLKSGTTTVGDLLVFRWLSSAMPSHGEGRDLLF
jgi:hypothetical protein